MSDARTVSSGTVSSGTVAQRGAVLAPRFDWAAEAGLADDEVGVLTRLLRIQMFVSEALDNLVAPHGVSVADYMVLASIRRGCTSPAELCRVLRRTTGGMTLTIARLINTGWVERTPVETDRRGIVMSLTPDGLAKATAIHGALHAWDDALDLPEADRDRIGVVLDEVTRHLTPHTHVL